MAQSFIALNLDRSWKAKPPLTEAAPMDVGKGADTLFMEQFEFGTIGPTRHRQLNPKLVGSASITEDTNLFRTNEHEIAPTDASSHPLSTTRIHPMAEIQFIIRVESRPDTVDSPAPLPIMTE